MNKVEFEKVMQKFSAFREQLEESHDVDIRLFKHSLDNPGIYDGSETLANGANLEAKSLILQLRDDHRRYMQAIEKKFDPRALDATQFNQVSALKRETVELFHQCLRKALEAVKSIDASKNLEYLVNETICYHPVRVTFKEEVMSDSSKSVISLFNTNGGVISPISNNVLNVVQATELEDMTFQQSQQLTC